MKDQRIQDAFDAFNPDDDALDRMWAKISAAYDEQVGNDGEGQEYKADVPGETASSAGEATERSVSVPEENRVAVASVADRSAEAGTSAAGASGRRLVALLLTRYR